MRSRRRPAPRRWHNRPGWRPARTAGWLTWTGRPDSATFARPVLKEVPGGGWFRTGQAVGGHVLPAGISAAAAAAPDLAEGVAGAGDRGCPCRPGDDPWIFHIGDRFTPLTEWDGYGT